MTEPTGPFDIGRALREIKTTRERDSASVLGVETQRLGDLIADGFRREFGESLDLPTCGKALVIAAGSVIPLCHGDAMATAIGNILAYAGEALAREEGDARG